MLDVMRGSSIVAAVLMLGLLGCKDDKAPSPSTAPPASPQPASPPPSSVPPALPSEPAAAPPAPAAPTASSPELDKLCEKAKEIASSPPGNQRVLWRRAVITIADPQIKKGFEAIGGVDPEPQYELALQIAKEAGAPGWTCPDLQKLLLSMQ